MLDNITIGNLRTNTNHPHPQVRGLMGITKNLTSVPKSISPHTLQIWLCFNFYYRKQIKYT